MPPKTLAEAGFVAVVTAVPLAWVSMSLVESEQIWVLIKYGCLALGVTGVMLLLRALGGWLRGDLAGKRVLRIFPGMVVSNVIPLQRHRPMPLMRELPNFGLVWSCVLFTVMFIFMVTTPQTPHGLLVDIRERNAVAGQKSPWTETLGVYVDDQRQFYVNGKLVAREKLGPNCWKSWGGEWSGRCTSRQTGTARSWMRRTRSIRFRGWERTWCGLHPGCEKH